MRDVAGETLCHGKKTTVKTILDAHRQLTHRRPERGRMEREADPHDALRPLATNEKNRYDPLP